jgi:small-conductance mechanosensitive channel
LLVLAAVAAQFHRQLGVATFDPVNFFSFFTIVSNVFGAAVLLAAAFDVPEDPHLRDVLRGLATLSLVIVGVVFSSLLANLDSELISWVNAVVHYAMPALIVVDWCVDPPHTRISRRDATVWLVLPAAYLAYSLVRGAIVHWYPYPFLNVDAIGYAGVAAYSAGILVFTLLAAYVVMTLGNTLRARANRTPVREA